MAGELKFNWFKVFHQLKNIFCLLIGKKNTDNLQILI